MAKPNKDRGLPESDVRDGVAPMEVTYDRALRPKCLAEYIGQSVLKEQLSVFLQAAKSRGDVLDHVLLYGPPGLGKTTLAQILAAEMGVGLRTTSGPVLDRPGDLAALLTQLAPGDVLFIDEIHRLSPVIEEILYPAMEDHCIDLIVGEGAESRSIQLPLAPFTLVGATTRAGALSAPLRDRFGITGRLEYYTVAELTQLVTRSASLLGVSFEPEAAEEVAKRSRGTPRIANRLVRRVRDYAEVMSGKATPITQESASAALTMLGVDQLGLDASDRKLMLALHEYYGGNPVGLATVSAAISEDEGTVADAIEPYLIQQGLLQRTPRGRQLTDCGRAHILQAA